MNPSRLRTCLCTLLCLTWCFGAGGQAQIRESGISLSQPVYATPANYSIAKPGELTMQVNVWGQVIHPGRYEVSIQTDLVQLLSYAGGPGPDAKMASVKITRFIRTDNGLSKTSWTTLRDILTVVGSVVVVAATVSTVVYNSHH